MINIKTTPSVDVKKLLEKAFELGHIGGQAVFVNPEKHLPDGIIIMWASPKTMDALIKLGIVSVQEDKK